VGAFFREILAGLCPSSFFMSLGLLLSFIVVVGVIHFLFFVADMLLLLLSELFN